MNVYSLSNIIFTIKFIFKILDIGIGEIIQWLRVLIALPEDLGSILSVTPVTEDMAPFHKHTCRQNTSAHKIQINNLKRNPKIIFHLADL